MSLAPLPQRLRKFSNLFQVTRQKVTHLLLDSTPLIPNPCATTGHTASLESSSFPWETLGKLYSQVKWANTSDRWHFICQETPVCSQPLNEVPEVATGAATFKRELQLRITTGVLVTGRLLFAVSLCFSLLTDLCRFNECLPRNYLV